MNRINARLILASTAVTLVTSPVLHAQSSGDAVELEEITVTAQKREQSFQSLAISAAVVTSEDLARTGVTAVQDAIRLVPGVKIQNIAGTGSGRVFIRGIGTTSGDEFNSVITNGVSMNIDGVNSNNASNMLSTMFDVERVEVLKGPQGTLYGSSSLGGVVNVISTRPSDKFEATAKVQVGNYDQRSVQAMVNIPIGDTFAFRITGSTNKRDGYVDGPATYTFAPPPPLQAAFLTTWGSFTQPADNHGAVDTKSYRVKAQWKPTDAFSALITYDHSKDEGTSPVWQNPLDVNNGIMACCQFGGPPSFAVPQWYANTFFERTNDTYTGEFSYDFGAIGVLTFSPSYNIIKDKGQQLSPIQLREAVARDQTQSTYELRLNSAADSRYTWVAGLYASSSDREFRTGGAANYTPSPDRTPGLIEYGLAEGGRPFDTFNAYAQITAPITDPLRLTAGARYSANKAKYSYELYRTGNPCTASTDSVPTPYPTCPVSDTLIETSGEISSEVSLPAVTGKIGFEYDVATGKLLYGHVATGFKAGGLQAANTANITSMSPLPLTGYKNEKSISYEVGSKNRFLDNTFQLNAAVFYTEWKNMQINTLVCSVPGCSLFGGDTYVSWYNAGPSTQYGLELDSIWAATANDRINFSVSWMHGEYGETSYPWAAPGFSGIVNLKGHEMAQTPSSAGNIAYSHIFNIGTGKLTTTLEGEFSSRYETTHEYYFAGHEQPGYFRNNASLTYDWGGLSVNAFVRNIQNKTTIQSVFPFGVYGGEPRVVGGSVQYKF